MSKIHTYFIVAESRMAKVCAICGKGKRMGNIRKLLRGHYNVTGRRSFEPNLQWTRVDGHRTLACVSCIRSQHKVARPAA